MTFIGVELSIPRGSQFNYLVRWVVIMAVVGIAAHLAGWVDLDGAKNLALGGMGSSFAMACGADTDRYGWRAWVVLFLFAIAACAVVDALIALSGAL